MMKEAMEKATSTRKDVSGAIAQILAVTAMLVIAGFAFFGRGSMSLTPSVVANTRASVAPVLYTEPKTATTKH